MRDCHEEKSRFKEEGEENYEARSEKKKLYMKGGKGEDKMQQKDEENINLGIK